jgi:hypothetical protein
MINAFRHDEILKIQSIHKGKFFQNNADFPTMEETKVFFFFLSGC